MDGVSQYVTLRRDLYTTGGLVAGSGATTSLPVASLAAPIITEQEPSGNQDGLIIDALKPRLITATSMTTEKNGQQQVAHDCSLCAKTFSSKALLTRHLKSHNGLGLPTVLSSPSSSPPNNSNLLENSSSSSLKCDQPACQGRSAFATQLSLLKHMKSQHGVKMEMEMDHTEIVTPRLGGSHSNDTNNKRGGHLHHHGHGPGTSGEKRFQCGQCSKRFPTSKDLKRHEVVHTGNRDFQCSFCSHRFGRKDHRMRHEKKTHANELSMQHASCSSPISMASAAAASSTPSHTTAANHSLTTSNSNNNNKSADSMVKVTEVEVNATSREKRQRWRHVSSPSVATVHPVSSGGHDCIEMKSVSIRTRAMSTCEQAASSTVRCHMHSSRQASLPVAASPTDAPLYNETSLKYLENQLSPESLLMEDNSSGDCSSKEADNEDWLMSDFMAGITGSKSPSSPPPQTGSPEPTSLSPLALYPTSDMCDVLTRTKNPVLPSVYIDNSSLIVPEPSKQKYHATTSLSLTVGDEDLEYYAEAFMDDKDSMFPV